MRFLFFLIFLINTAMANYIDWQEEPKRVKIMAVGDNLIHMPVIRSGKKKGGLYDYLHLYEPMLETINKFDIRIINQETILVKSPKQYSSYPLFGSPYAIGEALVKSGFNVISSATNHSLDKGASGVLETIEFWKKYPEITMLGLYENWEDYRQIAIRETKGIKIAYLNYTYGLNGINFPSNKSYLVKTLFKEDLVIEELQRAKKEADFVIVLPHWGTEYTHKITPYQRKWAKIFADNGADLIIGTHPHTVEPLEFIVNDEGKEIPCYFSLGNFVSAQIRLNTNLGAMAELEIQKNNDGVKIISAEIKGIITHRDVLTGKIQVYPLDNYSDKLGARHWLARRGHNMSKKSLENLFKKVSKE